MVKVPFTYLPSTSSVLKVAPAQSSDAIAGKTVRGILQLWPPILMAKVSVPAKYNPRGNGNVYTKFPAPSEKLPGHNSASKPLLPIEPIR
jgi:hypothetical protein